MNNPFGADIYVDAITFNDGNVIGFGNSDITVFTGANNSGKSQVLKELNNKYTGNNISGIVSKEISLNYVGTPSEGYLKSISSGTEGNYQIRGTYYGTYDHFMTQWSEHRQGLTGKLCIKYLPTDSRLTLANSAKSIDFTKDKPTEPLHELYIDDKKEVILDNYFYRAFGSHLIVNRGAGANITMHVGEKIIRQAEEDRVSASYLMKLTLLPKIEEQGDGMRSFAGILLHILTNHKSAIFLDEPEAFLHPPQARLLGEMLATYSPEGCQLFISTHSEDFLKGLLEAKNNNVKIIRINREKDINHISHLDNEQVKTLWKDSILRFSNILSGLFHSKVVLCEADTDCRFYQAILHSIYEGEDKVSPDVLFTHCGGKQRLKTVVDSLRSINVPVAVISDIDILNDKETFKSLTESLGIEWDGISALWKTIYEYVRTQRPQRDTGEVKKELLEVISKETEQYISPDTAEKLKVVIKMSSAWATVKNAGKSFFKGDAYTSFVSIDDICRKHGLFIVPVGELECFYKPVSGHGTKWVNEVLSKVDFKTDKEISPAVEFIKAII